MHVNVVVTAAVLVVYTLCSKKNVTTFLMIN